MMYYTLRRRGPRRGVILLVVLAFLALFAAVGVSFVLYAGSQAQSARNHREAETQLRPDVEAELLTAYFLGQLIHDVTDDSSGVYSALRGHSLARTMYGANDVTANIVPYNGTGRLHAESVFKRLGMTDPPSEALDDFYLINYTFFRDDRQLSPKQRFLRDPERLGERRGLNETRGPFTGGFNAPYTYPDLNSLFLAAVKADGTVLMPSFHRPWLFGSTDRSNPNWSNAAGKYLTLRPRPIDQKQNPNDDQELERFPYPEDTGGDAKNLIGCPGGNDSFWLDLDFPVLTTGGGRKFKPLFAPLIVDLDNRVNVNVHGNVRGSGQSHASNQGWGPWEVSLQPVLPRDNEAGNVLLGASELGRTLGRYGTDQIPGSAARDIASLDAVPPFYSRVDFDGYNHDQPPFGPSGPILLPGFGPAPYNCFPVYGQGYGNGSATEGKHHPLLFNLFQPAGDDQTFSASNLEAPLRFGDTGSSGLTSELFRLGPQNFVNPRTRRLITTHSFDVDRPGVTPWVWNAAEKPYRLTLGQPFPSGGAIPFPRLPLRTGTTVPENSEFQSPGRPPRDPAVDWRAESAALGRVDVNRPLPRYPEPDSTTGQFLAAHRPLFLAAQDARVSLARDIFERMRVVTGAAIPERVPPGSPSFNALRWLAQVAVNIVDYIDADECMTPFDWFTDVHGVTHWVFGTELPRVVLNEAYAEIANDPKDPGLHRPDKKAVMDFNVNFWVELLNPFQSDPVLSNQGAARLQSLDYAAYQLMIAGTPNPVLNDPANVTGEPNPAGVRLVVTRFVPAPQAPPPDSTVDIGVIEPVNGRIGGGVGKNQGFYVLGPVYDFPEMEPGESFATLRVAEHTTNGFASGMTYRLPNTTPLSRLPSHAILLRRLACPYLPPNPAFGGVFDSTKPYNPYVTVDVMPQVATNDGIVANADGPHAGTPVAARASTGRMQPYAAAPALLTPQRPSVQQSDQPRHTFFRHNEPRKAPFDWLVHLDRPLISPMELLQVSAFKPHELTQRFGMAAGSQDHRAPWLRPESRLYRLFEFLETHSLAAGSSMIAGGRIPGKINLNTIWDPETFLALCDPQPANVFRARDIYLPLGDGPGHDNAESPQSVYWRMMLSRTPQSLKGGGPGPKDRPFLSLATGSREASDAQFPGAGVNDTWLRADPVDPRKRLFETDNVGATHPYLRDQLLTKIFNHVTTRSHVFAVWLTVGFFEVTDETTRPVKLGAEIGRAEGRHIRHRLFAIVDRSNLTLSGEPAFVVSAQSGVPAPGAALVDVSAIEGASEGFSWRIRQGTRLVVDSGPNQEIVTVQSVRPSPPGIHAMFSKPHAPGFTITNQGNPGPKPRYNPREYPAVVRYVSVID